MEIGTHNSMTYLNPKKWYLYPFRFIARCQSKTIEEQYELGIRLFDIRISYNKDGNPEFRHGLMSYDKDVFQTLSYLNSKKVPIKIRILLEENKASERNENFFKLSLMSFQSSFPNLIFYEGRRKFDWKQIVKLPTLEVEQPISSMMGNKIDDLWPWLYAKLHNKQNYKLYKNSNKTVLFDFIPLGWNN